MAPGDQLEVTATDPGSVPDFQGWVKTAKHALLKAQRTGKDETGRELYIHLLANAAAQRATSGEPMAEAVTLRRAAPVRWAKVIDQTRCIGCHACSTACKSENQVPLGVHRTYVKYVDVGRFPQARRAFQVTRCNQCAEPPCVFACPTAAMYQRPDGIVDFDKCVCIGCKACIAACPYDAIFINPEDHSAEKCNFCAQRLDVGLEPACVVVCPTEAIVVGDLNDGTSRVSRDRRSRHASRCAGPRRGRGRSCSTRARTRRRSTRSPRAGRRAASSCGASRATGRQQVASGPPRRAQQRRGGDARLRRAAQRALGLPRQPLHVDEGHRGRRLPACPRCSSLAGASSRRSALWRWAAPIARRRLPRGDRRPADLRPRRIPRASTWC